MTQSFVESDITEIASRLGPAADALEGRKVLLAGGAGFIGRYLVALFRHLNAKQFKHPCRVTVVDNFITADGKSPEPVTDAHIQFVHGDVIRPLNGEAFAGPFEYIVQAAGIASPFYYRKYPLETLEVGTTGTKNLLQLAAEHRARGYLFFSSSEIYGDPDPRHVPTPESYRGNVSCTGPRACYDEAKRVGETLCAIFHQTHGVATKAVRPFNVYGPGMTRTDYRVVPNFAARIADGQPVMVYSDGRQTRTFCYVTDAIVGFLLTLIEGVPGEVYNIGNPTPEITMRELVDVFSSALGRPVDYKLIEYPDSYPADEPRRRCPDISKAALQLKYHPEVGLEDGIQRFMKWALPAFSAPATPTKDRSLHLRKRSTHT
jgi:UDP-glucuronate decarboxylase